MNSKKRGQYHPAAWVWISAFCLIFVVFFLMLLLTDIAGIRESTYVEKNFLVRDMATRIDAFYDKGNMILPYDKDTYWFCYEFNDEKVTTIDKTSTLQAKTEYPLVGGNLPVNPKTMCPEFKGGVESKDNLEKKVQLAFANINNEIIIDEEITKDINSIKCSNTEPIDRLLDKTVLIDAGHGSDDDGAIANDIKEKEVTGSIGYYIYENLELNKFFTRESEDNQIKKVEYKSRGKIIQEVENNNIDIIISIHNGNYDDNSNNIKAYYSIESDEHIQAQNRKIACTILNELINQQELGISGISIIPIHPEDYDGGEILVKDKIAVLLEIGNLNSQNDYDMLVNAQDIQTISSSIIRGLKNV